MDPATTGGGTPTTQWAPQSWWVGDDARSEDGFPSDHHPLQLPPATSGSQRRRSQLSAGDDADTDQGRIQQQGVPHRDPRSMFGDLPNSSLNPDLLGDPIQRELELRAAESAAVQTSPAPTHTPAVTFADIPMQPSAELGSGDRASLTYWREECGRLQDQLAGLAREKERWEWDRRRLLAEDVDRARDLAGLRRAVEAQSQLVMESLVVAQRLVASGATSTPAGGRTTVLSDDVLQTTWVQPNIRSATTRHFRWGQGGGVDAIEASQQWGFHLSPRAGIATNRVRSELGRAGIADDRTFDRKQSGSRRIADATTSPRGEGFTTTASIVLAEPPSQGRSSTMAASQASAPSRDARDPVVIANRNGNTDYRIAHSSAAVPISTEMMLAPRASFLAQKYTAQANADRAHSRVTPGWHRITSRGGGGSGGTTAGGDSSGENAHRESEVWEWNGRRVVLQGLTAIPPQAEKEPEQEAEVSSEQERALPTEAPTGDGIETQAISAAAATEAVAAPTPVLPASLLDDIQEIKAAVQALASGSFEPRAPIPQTLPEQAVAPTDRSSSEVPTSSHQPTPPDKPRGQEFGTSPSAPMSSPTRRRVSLPTSSNLSPVRQPRVSSITYIPNSDSTPSMQKQEESVTFSMRTENVTPSSNALVGGDSNSAEGVDFSHDDSPNGNGGNDSIETQRRAREGKQAQHHESHEGYSPRDEAPEVLETTHGKGEEPTSVHVPAVIPPSSALQEEGEGGDMRRRPSATRRSSGSGEGGTVDAAGGAHQEKRHSEDNPLVPVASEAHPSGFSSGDGGDGANGGGVVVDPETSIADEASRKHPGRAKLTAESIQPAEGDEGPNGSSSSDRCGRRISSGRAASASSSSADNKVGIESESIDDGGGMAIDEAPEKCHVG